jgi:p-aminobenzoyl-glutamate transporter AbgT
MMDKLEERVLVYIALLLLCSVASMFLGVAAAVWTFVQIASVIELMYLYGNPHSDDRARG